jgi:acetolactate synthase-1/2/3 large subunit
VPGESYLAVLDALFDSDIETVVARQEGGAAMMAEADGKLTGRPGVVFVTRGPGATNAASGIHVARQDSTPLIVFVGQIARGVDGREAFQEVDYRQTFSNLAKWVTQIDDVSRIPEVISHAYHVAMNGRPGPVVIALPEDMLREQTANSRLPSRIEPVEVAPTTAQLATLAELLGESRRPIIVAGGSRWDVNAVDQLQRWAESARIPVAVSFRRQQLFDHLHPLYAGDLGIGANPKLIERIRSSDLLIVVGARLSENPSQNFTLLEIPEPRQRLVHVLSGAEELGRIYHADLAINATPGSFLSLLSDLGTTSVEPDSAEAGQGETAHEDYLAWTRDLPDTPGDVKMGQVMHHLRETTGPDTIVTNGAGNYSIWVHRYWRYRQYGTQVAPTSGSMGYGLPAAIAASLRHPEQEVICFAGDGCLQMTIQELAVVARYQLNLLVMVVDNGSYGTIRMHQERNYPGRVSATGLANPDFAALAQAYGIPAYTVTQSGQFAEVLSLARSQQGPALIHLLTSVDAITPTQSLQEL